MNQSINKEVLIIDYGAGNIQSILFALQRIGYTGILSNNPEEVLAAERIIFPGVGEAASAMKKLRATGLHRVLPHLRQPVLGICLGMQLMCAATEEGTTEGLGIFDVEVVKFDNRLKVPSIGWNQIHSLHNDLFRGVEEGEFVYMVHSFYAEVCAETTAVSEYGVSYSAGLQKDNFYGLQFHPEKSGPVGETILRNFLNLQLISRPLERKANSEIAP